jgi:hypothetical protein
MRDRGDSFSKLSSHLPAHRLERKGTKRREGLARVEFNKSYSDRTQENRPKVRLIVQQSLYTGCTMRLVSRCRYPVSSPSVIMGKPVSKQSVIVL